MPRTNEGRRTNCRLCWPSRGRAGESNEGGTMKRGREGRDDRRAEECGRKRKEMKSRQQMLFRRSARTTVDSTARIHHTPMRQLSSLDRRAGRQEEGRDGRKRSWEGARTASHRPPFMQKHVQPARLDGFTSSTLYLSLYELFLPLLPRTGQETQGPHLARASPSPVLDKRSETND